MGDFIQCKKHGMQVRGDKCPKCQKEYEVRVKQPVYYGPGHPDNPKPKVDKIYCLHDEIGFVELVDKMEHDVPLKVVNSARVSYGGKKEKFDEKDKKLTGFLWEHGHTSPFRHSFYSFHVKCPLFVFRQWTKYQVGSVWREYEAGGESISVEAFDLFYDTDKGCSWNELSGRYAELKPEFYIPQRLRGNPAHGDKQASKDFDWTEERHTGYGDVLREKYEKDYRFYQDCLVDGIAKELARITLPQSIYSEAYWTVSLQGVIHFLQQRLDPNAQYEIRQMAVGVYQLIKEDLDKIGVSFEDLLNA
jgi:thymidylate synthase (FAD)